MNTLENNKLIAEFMGGVLSQVPNLINIPQTKGEALILCEKGSSVLPNGTYALHRINELKYHKSWDWLMPVVDKVSYQSEAMKGNFELETWAIYTNTINHVYERIIEFIKWYNENKQ